MRNHTKKLTVRLLSAIGVKLQLEVSIGVGLSSKPAGGYDKKTQAALSWAEKAMQQQPNFFVAACFAAASAALAGRLGSAEKALSRVRQLKPELRISNLPDTQPFRRPDDLNKLAEGLRIAGLPE